METSRFKKCVSCGWNANQGFSGPPACDKKLVPEQDGSCATFTTEVPDQAVPAKPEVEVMIANALPLLKRVATSSRFNGDRPVIVVVGHDYLQLRAVDGAMDVRLTAGERAPVTMRAVVGWEELNAAAEGHEALKLSIDGRDLMVGAKKVEGRSSSVPIEFADVELSGTSWEVPPLPGTCMYLLRALKNVAGPYAYALLELPYFAFVTTDAQRLHAQFLPGRQAEGVAEHELLLSKDQLCLLWESTIEGKRLELTNLGCRVTGALDGFQVEMDFKTGSGEFPKWRTLLNGYGDPVTISTEALRDLPDTQPGELVKLAFTVGTPIKKDSLRDALVGWPDPTVKVYALNEITPVVLEGSDRTAVIMYSKVVEAAATNNAVQVEVKKMATKAKKAVQTSAPIGTPAVKHFEVGSTVETPNGAIKVLQDRIAYLVVLPNGKKRWYSDAALQAMVAGQPVAAESEEAA